MKSKLSATLLGSALALLFSGCVSSRPALVTAPVGPPALASQPASPQGTLLVFSAYKVGMADPGAPFGVQQHSDYQLRSEDGHPLREVVNGTGYQNRDPLPIHLPPGRYQVIAQSNGYGLVTVPVIIAARQTTTVHLEGGGPRSDQAGLNAADSVRLPNGQIVGWKASE